MPESDLSVLSLPYSGQVATIGEARHGSAPDTSLMGVNHLRDFGIQFDVLDPPESGGLASLGKRVRSLVGVGSHIERNLLQQAASLSLRDRYDCVLLGSKENIVSDGVVRGISRVSGPPTIGLDVQLSRNTRFRRIIKLLISKTQGFAVLSRQIAQDLESFGIPENRIYVMAYGVDDEYFKPRDEDDEMALDVFSVGHACRDYRTLLKAVGTEYTTQIASWGVALPGGGQQSVEELRRLCSSAENVEVEYAPPDVLRQLYARARAVVVPLFSTELCAGITTLLEARAMGKAPIVSWNRNVTDYVENEENGFIVPPGDSEALHQKIQFVMDNPSIAEKMGRAARRSVEEKFSTRREAMTLAKIIREVVASAS